MGFLKGMPDIDIFLDVTDRFLREIQRKGLLDLMKLASENLHNAIELKHREKIMNKELELFDTLIKSLSECPPESRAEIIRELITILEKSKTK